MPTLDYLTGFEGGVLSTSGGGLANTINGNATVQTLNVRTGTYSLRCAPTAAAAGDWVKTLPGTPTGRTRRFYVYITSAPTAWAPICRFDTGTSTNRPTLAISATNFEIRAGTTLIATGPAYSVNTWYRVDFYVDVSANPWQLKAKIDGGTEFSGTSAQAADTITNARLGSTNATGPAYTAFFDDVADSATLADYPIGAGEVVAISPNADGTHSPATPDCIRGGGASPALISGGNAAYQYMDDVPFPTGTSPTTDRINQDIATSHVDHYVEMAFADLVGSPTVNGVMGLLAYGGNSATANKGGTVAVRSDATQVNIHGGAGAPADMSETTVFYKSAIITAPGGGWTPAEVNALKMRIGYSTDITPNPYWQALMFEVDYVPGGAPPTDDLATKVAFIPDLANAPGLLAISGG